MNVNATQTTVQTALLFSISKYLLLVAWDYMQLESEEHLNNISNSSDKLFALWVEHRF